MFLDVWTELLLSCFVILVTFLLFLLLLLLPLSLSLSLSLLGMGACVSEWCWGGCEELDEWRREGNDQHGRLHETARQTKQQN